MKRLPVVIAAVAIVAAGAAALSLNEKYRGFEKDVFVRVDHGEGTMDMGRALAQAGVIRYPWQFWMTRVLHPSAKLQAGEYRFRDAAKPGEIFLRIERGDVYYFELTVIEGSNMFDIARQLEAAGLMTADDFLTAAADASSIRDFAPKAPSLEGFLFPSTYRLSHSITAAELCRLMTAQFRRQWKKLAGAKAADAQQTVTLASLVEKETGVGEERPLVAGVFENRLKKNMPLQCDPTTIYAALLENRYRGAIHRSDLGSKNPYNTYQHTGLPPGPIANPGADSIAAALAPAETDYLYFVANANGPGHRFSTTLAAHEKAVSSYRHQNAPAKKTRKAG
jgi:UPF0755 protein